MLGAPVASYGKAHEVQSEEYEPNPSRDEYAFDRVAREGEEDRHDNWKKEDITQDSWVIPTARIDDHPGIQQIHFRSSCWIWAEPMAWPHPGERAAAHQIWIVSHGGSNTLSSIGCALEEKIRIIQSGASRHVAHIAISKSFCDIREGGKFFHSWEVGPYRMLILLLRNSLHQFVQQMPLIHDPSSFDH